MSAPTPERGGKARRMFSLEAPGLAALQESLKEIREMTEGLDVATLPGWSS